MPSAWHADVKCTAGRRDGGTASKPCTTHKRVKAQARALALVLVQALALVKALALILARAVALAQAQALEVTSEEAPWWHIFLVVDLAEAPEEGVRPWRYGIVLEVPFNFELSESLHCRTSNPRAARCTDVCARTPASK